MTHKSFSFTALAAGCLLTLNLSAQTNSTRTFQVKANQVYAEIAPTMYGIFFEDINIGADGGIYAELVKNRSFEFDTPLMGWKELKKSAENGNLLILNTGLDGKANPRYLRLTSVKENSGHGISNEGFRGMGIKAGEQYNFSVSARVPGNGSLPLLVKLVNAKGDEIASAKLSPAGQEWKTYQVSLTAKETDAKAQLQVLPQAPGVVDLDMVSLFPKNTWKQRPNGMRADMVQLLADMKPGFLRFPGGCIVEGYTLDNRYQWKNTIGPIAERETLINRWNTEFKHRHTPDYFQTFGLGFFEYFQLAEDLGAAPLPILNCGMACQYNTGEVVPLDQLEPFIQDALDLIEFANGPADSQWGKVRAQMGHPAPFNLKYLGIGNEQWGPQYVERYKLFEKALKAKYPEVQLISSVGPSPDGAEFEYLSKTMRELKADLVDEHYYRSPEWFLKNASRYDQYDRQGPKVFAGEYAAHVPGTSNGNNNNVWKAALAEAAFMTGFERNADVVLMTSYAPLFAHAEAWQWAPDMIWIDNLKAYGTPNYYVQKLFSTNVGTHVVPIQRNNAHVAGQDSLYASASLNKKTNELILKVVNTSDKAQESEFVLDGVKSTQSKGTVQKLRSSNLQTLNSFDNPTAISPVQQTVQVKNKRVKLVLEPYSVNVIKVKVTPVAGEYSLKSNK